MRIASALALFLSLVAGFVSPTLAAENAFSKACRQAGGGKGDAAEVLAALGKLRPLLSEPQRAALEHPLNYDNTIHWSNLPLSIVPRTGLRLGDLDPNQTTAARQVFEAAFSACGLKLLDEIHLADDWLIPFDKRPVGWGGGNYFLAVL